MRKCTQHWPTGVRVRKWVTIRSWLGLRAPPSRPATRGGDIPGAARVPWGTISREQVIETATAIVRAGGYEEMTIRSLAAELGVGPMSLYRHVRDKDDLLDEVVDRLLAKAWRPSPVPGDWQAWIAAAANKFRNFLVNQPAALHVFLRHPVVSPAAVARMNAMMEVLRDVTPDEDSAKRAYAAIHTYTLGFAALEASRAGWEPDRRRTRRPGPRTRRLHHLANSSPPVCATSSTASNETPTATLRRGNDRVVSPSPHLLYGFTPRDARRRQSVRLTWRIAPADGRPILVMWRSPKP